MAMDFICCLRTTTLMTDPVSLSSFIVAVIALWISWDMYRKTTRHIFRVIQVSSEYTQSIEEPLGCHSFRIYIKNLGLPFPKMTVILGFRIPDGMGWASYPLLAFDIPTKKSTLFAENISSGQVVQFGWKMDQMNIPQFQMLKVLKSLRKQEAIFTVYSSGYKVGNIPIESPSDRIKKMFNGLFFSISQKLKLGIFALNQKTWKARIRFPQYQTISFALTNFLEAIDFCEKPRDGINPSM